MGLFVVVGVTEVAVARTPPDLLGSLARNDSRVALWLADELGQTQRAGDHFADTAGGVGELLNRIVILDPQGLADLAETI